MPFDSFTKNIHLKVTLPRLLIGLGTLLVGLVLRAQYIEFVSLDYFYFLSKWVLYIREHGLFSAYGVSFHNYAMLYPYMLGLFDALFTDINPIYTVKLLSFAGELYAAYYAYHIVALHYRDTPDSLRPTIAVVALLLCPSVVSNGSMTGQCDIWLTGFMLACLYSLMTRKTKTSLVYAGVAFCFKPQAVFFAPMLLVLLLRKDISWKLIWIIPATYVALCVPSWLQGRTMDSMLLVYWVQIRGYVASYHAANPYFYFNNNTGQDLVDIIHIGEAIAATLASILVALNFKQWKAPITALNCLLVATLFASVMPFVLPLMHDRYFFMADVFSLLLVCMLPRWFLLPILFQTSSLIASVGGQIPKLGGLAGWVQAQTMTTAIIINVVAISMVLWLCYQHLWKKQSS
jgi:Gpi18-like mannosyltransferase